jgi:hypothetical protein
MSGRANSGLMDKLIAGAATIKKNYLHNLFTENTAPK